MENYSKHAESMFADEASPAIRWEDGLQCFASIAKDAGIEWWTSGYILLALRGCPVEINDLDFYFHLRDLDRVYDAFSDYIIEPIAKTAGTWREGSFRYCGLAYAHCPICLFVDPLGTYDDPEPTHFGMYASEHLESIAWKGHTIHVPPIALYIRTLERWGKTEKARQIMEWIG